MKETAKFCLDPDTGMGMLPMTDPYCQPYMFVRDCFREYYGYVKSILDCKYCVQYVTISGTDGIGKSMYYNWFCKQYRLDNPEQNIVCASFGKDRILKRCVVFSPNMPPVEHFDSVPLILGAMYMYDGPPHKFTSIYRMIAFVGSNDEWPDCIDIGRRLRTVPPGFPYKPVDLWGGHVKLYMPVWTLEELIDAAECLGLDIEDEEMFQRRSLFGGLPKYCLLNPRSFKVAKREFQAQLADSVKTPEAMETNYGTGRSEIACRLFHYGPVLISGIYDNDTPPLPADKIVITSERMAILELCKQCPDRGMISKVVEALPHCLEMFEKLMLKKRRDVQFMSE